MDSKRLQQIEEIYHEVLGGSTEEREALLDELCGSDADLRREVESLLSFDNAPESFLESPPEALAAEMFSGKEDAADLVGKEISHYKVIRLLGTGGMGEVYLAEDTKLRRKVALKTLPSEFASDDERKKRFEMEAHSISALNHPNIITIFEIQEADDVSFMATEFVDGHTLRHLIAERRLSWQETIDIGVQIAGALESAHSVGIIHRDIKPANIMVRRDGIVKVLDFGLAKLTAPDSGDFDTRDLTGPNRVMGTVYYMSPEQALGERLDERTDIFSFGIVLFEMLTGTTPFGGANSTANTVPTSVYNLNDEIPTRLDQIVKHALKKDRDARYRSIADLRADLQNLQRDSQTDSSDHAFTEKTVLRTDPDHRTSPNVSGNNTLPNATASWLSKRLLVFGLAAAVIVLGGLLGYRYFSSSSAINSIAVLPFENRTGNADSEYLSDGLAESLIYRLSHLPDLKVSPTSSVFRYKGKETDPQAVAKELGVDSVMTGRITQRGDNLTISVELVDIGNRKLLWGEQYERKMSELLTTQREIANEIVGKLKLKLSGEGSLKLAKNYTDNSEAYQLYLKGRYHWNKRTISDFQKAVVFFRQATEKDPYYALAYSGLADTYALFEAYGDFRATDYMPLAKQAALKALELDPDLAEAHASVGAAIFYWDYDWAGAEKAYKRAIELDPKYATARLWYGELLSLSGRHDEALMEVSKAVEFEPFSMIINREKVKYLRYAKRFDEALSLNRKVNEMFPNQEIFHDINGTTYEAQGNYTQAFEEYWLSAKAASDADPENLKGMKDSFENGGWDSFQQRAEKQFLAALNAERTKDPDKYIPAINYATAYAYGKDKEKTLEYLSKGIEERSMAMLYIKVGPQYFFLHDDPRFKELVRKVGIPD
jgi:serine/threonine protein kinase/tetratricopeptide (TPR) repeat protein